MLLKISVCLILLVGTVLSATPRCCKEGGLYHHRNRTFSCVPAPIPDSLNIEPYKIYLSQSEARVISINDTDDYRCRDILFDEATGLVMHTLVIVKMDTLYIEPIAEHASKPRFVVKKCCKDDEVMESYSCSERINDMYKSGYIMYKFKNYYGSGDRPLTSDVRTKSNVTFGKGGLDSRNTNDVFVLGDDILEASNKSPAVESVIVNAAEKIEWCIHDSSYTGFGKYTLNIAENSLGVKSKYIEIIKAMGLNV